MIFDGFVVRFHTLPSLISSFIKVRDRAEAVSAFGTSKIELKNRKCKKRKANFEANSKWLPKADNVETNYKS